MTPTEVETLLAKAMPSARHLSVLNTSEQSATIKMKYGEWMLRPGNTLSGPSLMAAADAAMYVLILATQGPELMAVTSNLNINFINRGEAGDIIATARLLKAGRKMIYLSVELFDHSGEILIAHATGSYSRP